MGQAVAIAVALIAAFIGGSVNGLGGALFGGLIIGGMAWLAFAWKPTPSVKQPGSSQQRPSQMDAGTPVKNNAQTQRSPERVEDLYAMFFVAAIKNELEMDVNSSELKALGDLSRLSPPAQDIALLNIAIVHVALCTIVINFLSDLRMKVDVAVLMDRLSVRARDTFAKNVELQNKGLLKGRLADWIRTGAERDTLKTIYKGAYEHQDLIQLDVLFDALLHHRVKDYGLAFANSNDQPILGGRSYEVAYAFCVNMFGPSFEKETSAGATAPMMLTALFNTVLDTLLEGLEVVNQQLHQSPPAQHLS